MSNGVLLNGHPKLIVAGMLTLSPHTYLFTQSQDVKGSTIPSEQLFVECLFSDSHCDGPFYALFSRC